MLKMSEIKVGMRLIAENSINPITVTEITDKGFKYEFDDEIDFVPRWGLRFSKAGHEHYGYNDQSFYNLSPDSPVR